MGEKKNNILETLLENWFVILISFWIFSGIFEGCSISYTSDGGLKINTSEEKTKNESQSKPLPKAEETPKPKPKLKVESKQDVRSNDDWSEPVSKDW